MSILKPIAFYLPQFHPIPENDGWWGKGFTEWTNVAKARPLFDGHWQPRLPGDLGFYDLRVSETRIAQAELAKQYGIYGFSYWHYWFAGKQILGRPLQEVVSTGQPDFPFCIAWANQTWSGTWHGLSHDQTLIQQTYPGVKDYETHFYSLLEAFQDSRYIQVNGKRLFLIFKAMEIPEVHKFIDCWRNLAVKEGIIGFHFLGMHQHSDWNPKDFGFDGFVQGFSPWVKYKEFNGYPVSRNIVNRIRERFRSRRTKPQMPGLPSKVSYKDYVLNYPENEVGVSEYPLICSDWDNTPRSGFDGWLFKDFSFELFGNLCFKAFDATKNKPADQRLVFIKSWNEWAEGNYLEPDQKHGHSYLETFSNALTQFKSRTENF